jgi:pimeloyl-ACP methyl ester carboxylesterase
MSTGIAKANGIDICYETFGDAKDPALLLVMGLGAQMILWDPEFCELLVEKGFHVIRYDNRDTGLSTKIEGKEPNLAAAMAGDASSASYTLYDMAADGMGLLDTLGIAKAHVVGASMGGMIVQAMAIKHPERILSMCSIMSTTGARDAGQAKPEAMAALVAPRPETRDGVIEASVTTGKLISGGGFPFDEELAKRRAGEAFDRANYPIGMTRQLVGIMATGDRTDALKKVRVPTVVIHGADDPLVTLSGGQATAAAIPDAKLVVIPGMGHEIPAGVRPQIVQEIVTNTKRALVAR